MNAIIIICSKDNSILMTTALQYSNVAKIVINQTKKH